MSKIDPETLKAYFEAKESDDLPSEDALISVNAAAIKYELPPTNISAWIKRGWIRAKEDTVGRGQKRLIFEQDVAILSRLYPYGRQLSAIMSAVN